MTAPTIGTERFDDPFLSGLREVGDPPADAVVADYLDGRLSAAEGHLIAALIAHGASSTDEGSAPLRDFVEEQPAWPAWADAGMVRRGQDIFAEHVPQLGLGLWMASIPAGYAGAHGAEVLTHTTRLVSDAKRRFLETGQFIIDVMTPGGMQPGGRGARDIRHVRLMHASARHLLLHHETEASAGFDVDRCGVPVNQEDLLGTLFTFSVIGLQVLERSGVRLPQADLEAYVHCWNVVGHGMGIRDDLLPLDVADSRAVFARVQRRAYARSDAGVELTAAAIEVMQELLTARILRGVPAAGIREYLGDEIADLLEVPRARLSRLAFVPDRWFNRWSARVEQDSRLARRMSQALGRRLFQGFLDVERTGRHRPRFELDDALKEQLGLE
jgi:hypothetical protein